jgi:adenylate cyclase class 1
MSHTMSRQELRPDIDEGIDRKTLTQVRARFLQVNQGRLARAMQALSSRQQSVLRLLPLLLHVNHPLLPGYVSAQTPAGLCGYEPSAEVLSEAQRLTRSFTYKGSRGAPPAPILGLFLMGSLGTLAQEEESDMDFWVCHDPSLSPAALAELQNKCSLLEAWATTQGSEAHFFLINPQRFAQGERDGKLTSDDCGTTQHYLLLDEFYRTALWLGGRTPLWWLVPAYEEARYPAYGHILLSKRFIREGDALDLGHLARIPPGEFLGAGMWQLFKGIESPYKAVLKLLLSEVYASEHPQVECLALRFKQAVFAHRLDLDELDPYMVVYRRLEEYLQGRGELERLELIRRCLYLKANKKLSRPPRQGRKSWQRLLLERLTQAWNWDHRQLARLDDRGQWKVRQVSTERRALVHELTYSYRFLLRFAREQQAISPLNQRDFALLGRRLYAAFERKASKVECINPGIAPDLAEDTLTLVHSANPDSPETDHWALYSGTLNHLQWPNFAQLKRARDLIELLAWAHRNGVIAPTTRLSLHPGTNDLSEAELFNLIGSLQQLAPLPLPAVSDATFLKPSAPSAILLLVNVALDPLPQHSQMNLHMLSERDDSLGYAGVRDNLVLSLDQVSLNSWNELLVSRYSGRNALLDCLRDLLNSLPAEAPLPRILVRCFCRNRAAAIASRVEQLLHEMLGQLRQAPCRYLLQVQQRFQLFHLAPGAVRYQSLGERAELLRYLGQAQPEYQPLQLDTRALEHDDLRPILSQARPHCIQVFYRLQEDQAQLTLLDEHNALWSQTLPYRDLASLLNPLQRFLQSLLYRRDTQRSLDAQLSAPAVPTLELRYYEVLPAGLSRAQSIEPRPVPQAALHQPYYNVQAIIEHSEAQRAQVTLFCNQREFSELEYGQNLYAATAQHILSQRRTAERYPCYLTDLDVSRVRGEGPLQTIHFLRYKAELEQALNRALQQT